MVRVKSNNLPHSFHLKSKTLTGCWNAEEVKHTQSRRSTHSPRYQHAGRQESLGTVSVSCIVHQLHSGTASGLWTLSRLPAVDEARRVVEPTVRLVPSEVLPAVPSGQTEAGWHRWGIRATSGWKLFASGTKVNISISRNRWEPDDGEQEGVSCGPDSVAREVTVRPLCRLDTGLRMSFSGIFWPLKAPLTRSRGTLQRHSW